MSRRSRIAHFKTPFLISVAAPAVFGLACGGKTEVEDPIGGAGSSSVGNGGSAPILPPPSAPCNGTAPDTGDSCSAAVCVDGHWQTTYSGGCNPPPPLATACPGVEPGAGTSCAGYIHDLRCEYDFCGGITATRRCNGSTFLWEELISPGACNPPRPELECPDEMPLAGSDCSFAGQQCRYDGCLGPGTSVAICGSGQWTTAYSSSASCNPPAIQPVCPTRELSAGESCAFEGQVCSNALCSAASRDGLVCSAGAWRATVLSCEADAGADSGF